MAKKKERTEFTRQNYVSTFQAVGKVVLNDKTFFLDQQSEKSDWIYNRLSLMIDCGPESGMAFVSCLGGYGSARDNVVYVHGKKPDGSEDWSNSYTISFEDRKNETILAELGRSCFKVAGLERDTKGKTVYKNILTEYDFIEYISEHLEDGMVVNVRGNIQYQFYNGNTSMNLNLTNIALSNAEPEDYRARFTQSILIDESSKGEIDKEAKELDVSGYVLEWMKEYRGHDLGDGKSKKGEIAPLPYSFKYKLNMENPELTKKAVKKLFGIKTGTVTLTTFEGMMVSSGAVVQMTEADLDDDIRELVSLGIMDLDEALTACATNGNRERKMVLLRPRIKNTNQQDGTFTHEVQIFPEMYQQEDLNYFLEMAPPEEPEGDIGDAMNAPDEEEPEEVEFDGEKKDGEQWDWLNDL